MIEETAGRFQSTEWPELEFADLLVIGAKRHEALLDAQLPHAQMILEPMGRNSAPAVAAACIARAPDDLVLILPADHDIRDVKAFHEAIASAATAAQDGAIVTFGIQPSHPATGYGYIKAGASTSGDQALDVEAFVEKPDFATAQSYLDSGGYYWNAGIFLFKAGVMLEALEAFAPDVAAGTRQAMGAAGASRTLLDPEAFAATPSISIDYAVMEKASNVKTVPVSMGWSDVGGYRALHELLTESDADNYTSGPVHLENSSGLYVRSEGPAIAINGVSNLVVVATENEVMITPKDDDAAVKSLGKAVQKNGATLGLSRDLQARAKDWLWIAFDTWSKCAWDPERGGFVEQLHMDGAPDRDANRRVRVQARQVFSFAKAIDLGWPGTDQAKRLIAQGLDYLDTKLRHPDGGWVHVVDPSGEAVDDKRDLYDHAFIILAGATAYKVTDSALGLRLAKEALSFVDTHLKDHEFGGWREAIPDTLPRRSNPHMHMLEAMMAMYEATGDEGALERATEIVTLFEGKFFVPGVDVLAEYFEQNWEVQTADIETIFEPGHHFEWATLLAQYSVITGRDTLSWRRRLIRRIDIHGINQNTELALNALRSDGSIVSANSRLWHQLEHFRSLLWHAGMSSADKTESLLHRVFSNYLDRGPVGGWVDEVDADGSIISTHVPASMLYHLITAFGDFI
jgi:mannose-1-phosphate guanylyltransferase/mannose/cellobiose epimerase-like protein (N-acyl-D-glucosamine 2-epimerase family)